MSDLDRSNWKPSPSQGGAIVSDPSPDLQPYLKEIEERGEYVRHNAALFANWFTWHAAVNFGAVSWLATSVTDKDSLKTKAIVIVPVVFLIVSPLAFGACLFMYRSLVAESERVRTAWKSLVEETRKTSGSQNLMPTAFYTRCVVIMASGCALLASVWILILVYILVWMPTAKP